MTHEQTLARNAAIVGGATLVSRVLGFARDCAVAAVLGAGPLADAFFIALRLPNLMRRLFGEGSLSLSLVSEFSHVRQASGTDRAYAMVRACLAWLVLILGAVSLAAHAGAASITAVLAPGFLAAPELFARTADLVRLCFPYAPLICVAAVFSGILQAQGHFLVPALVPCVLNVALIAGAFTALAADLPVPETLGVCLLAAGVLQVAMQLPALRRRGFSPRGTCSLSDEGARRVGSRMLPAVFGAAVYQVSIVVTTMLASLLPEGSISHLYYADRLVQFPLGVFGLAVGTAALPALASLAAKGDHAAFRSTLATSMRLTLFISLPAAAGLAGMAEPIVNVLFGRGAFGPADVHGTVLALWGYAAGLPAFAAARPLLAAFHARRDARTPVAAAVGGLFVTTASGLALMQPMGHTGLAVAVTLGSWANVLLLHHLLARREQALFAAADARADSALANPAHTPPAPVPFRDNVATAPSPDNAATAPFPDNAPPTYRSMEYRLPCLYAAMSAGVFVLSRACVLLAGSWALAAIPIIIACYMVTALWFHSPDIFFLRQALRGRNG
ncbi:murein biosynthesis integral membrane protein MurJ [Desulfovibrio psychrotolerans]|uniref:Probable lipid II flippase MurJ n=1 Tax=Desulfovibrio psychrotolerans TaxID=415242 RepID=A0A7J0BY16_9BACT|nr:murein biosynthesis integral membrane protein MurJ [Desulfovibrio psychrotolerans]GFM38596.1 putative lipid II flippase MurJ [Desulfovibrio psychrotolerans]